MNLKHSVTFCQLMLGKIGEEGLADILIWANDAFQAYAPSLYFFKKLRNFFDLALIKNPWAMLDNHSKEGVGQIQEALLNIMYII